MKKVIMLAMILGFAVLGIAYAQEAAAPVAAPIAPATAPDAQEAYGEVASINASAASITITEYDYEKDEDVNKTYTVDKTATFENVKSLGEIKVGDWVALTLKPQKDGANIATSVYVERYDIGEEAAPVAPVTQAPAVVTPAPEIAPAPVVTQPAPVAVTTAVQPQTTEAPAVAPTQETK